MVNIRSIDLFLHIIAGFMLWSPFAFLPDLPLLALIGSYWVSDQDIRMRIYYLFHEPFFVFLIALFGWRHCIAWLSHLLIDQITH